MPRQSVDGGGLTSKTQRYAERGFSAVEVLAVLAVVAVLARLAIPAYNVFRQRVGNSTVLTDVLNAGKALEALDGTATFSRTVTGPGSIPGLPGPRISKGTTLLVRRSRQGNGYTAYVRGTHRDGSATYYFQNGAMSAAGARL